MRQSGLYRFFPKNSQLVPSSLLSSAPGLATARIRPSAARSSRGKRAIDYKYNSDSIVRQEREERAQSLSALSCRLGIVEPSDWYKITKDEIIAHGGGSLLAKFKNSPSHMVMTILTNVKWQPWRFHQQGFWREGSNRKFYLAYLRKQLSLDSPEAIQKVSRQEIIDNGGQGLLVYHKYSMTALLAEMTSNFEQIPWNRKVPKEFWLEKKNQQDYLTWLAKKLKFRKYSDFYKLTKEIVEGNRGSGLLKTFDNSPLKLLRSVLTGYEWRPWKFAKAPRKTSVSDLRALMFELESVLNLPSPEDWARVPVKKIPFGNSVIESYGGLQKVLLDLYGLNVPDSLQSRFSRKRKDQREVGEA